MTSATEQVRLPDAALGGAESVVGGSTRTVERALALLSQVCAVPSISLSECARRADLPTSTALRLLRTLENSHFVSRSAQGNFTAGPRLIQLGVAALSREALVPAALPALHRLVRISGETAYVSIPGPDATALYAGMVEGTHPVRHAGWVGRTVPLTGTAVGRALSGGPTEHGYVAVRSAVEPDVTAIAAAVHGSAGVIGAVSIVGPTYRITDPRIAVYGPAIAAEAARLGGSLGGAVMRQV